MPASMPSPPYRRSAGRTSAIEIKWVQQYFFAKLGHVVVDELTPPTSEPLQEIDPGEYYAMVGHDGRPLRVPSDLDESICTYLALGEHHRERFDRAAYWLDVAARQWEISMSASSTSLVSSVEALCGRGVQHPVYCKDCKRNVMHNEVPGATERFHQFFEQYAPGESLQKARVKMYRLRSGISHGGRLMKMDQNILAGWDPPAEAELSLHRAH